MFVKVVKNIGKQGQIHSVCIVKLCWQKNVLIKNILIFSLTYLCEMPNNLATKLLKKNRLETQVTVKNMKVSV